MWLVVVALVVLAGGNNQAVCGLAGLAFEEAENLVKREPG